MSSSAKGLPEGASVIIPRLFCRDVAAEIEFCKNTFGAVERVRRPGPDGSAAHAMLTIGPAIALLQVYRRILPRQAASAIRTLRLDALMAQWRLVTRGLVDAVHGAGAEIYVWTVDEAAQIARLEALGVDGVISNDPRLFG